MDRDRENIKSRYWVIIVQDLSLELIFSLSLFLWLGSSIVINVGGKLLVYIGHFDYKPLY